MNTTIEIATISVAIAGALAFLILYPALSPFRSWRREGWHLWTFTLVLLSLGCASLARRIFPEIADTWVYAVWMFATYAGLAGMMWWRVALLLNAPRVDKENRDA